MVATWVAMGNIIIFSKGWEMKLLLTVCLILSAFLSSCTKLIKNEKPIIETETESISASKELSGIKYNQKLVRTVMDLKGLWVGSFNAKDEYLTKQLFDNGKTPWHKEYKITIAIDSIQGSTLYGYSVVAGITKKIEGNVQEQSDFMSLMLTEKGNDRNGGTYTLHISKLDTALTGNWNAIKNNDIPERLCRFSKREFSYNPEISFVESDFVSEDISLKQHVDYPQEYDKWYEAVQSKYDIIFTKNPSIEMLTDEDVGSLSSLELMLLRNTIFARHGYAFKKRPLRIYFEKQPWYVPVSSNPKAGLTAIENQNIALIVRYEKNFGQYDVEYGR